MLPNIQILSENVLTSIRAADELNIRMYPNPANNYVVVETNEDELVSFSLYNLLGNLVSKEYISHGTTIDLSNIVKGLYIVRLEGSKAMYVSKLVIE